MSENKFIKRLKGEQTAKSVLEIKNESAKTSFANMPQGTSNAINVFSDHRGNATAVLNGTINWKVSNSDLLLVDTVSGDGQDFTSTYTVIGTGLWVNASYTFPSTGDPRHPIAMVFNPSTKWVLKVCGDNLIVDGGSTVDFTMLIKIGTSNVYSKNFTIRENAGQFSKEFIIDFGEANSDIVKAAGLSTLTVQLLCGTANASARIYNGMTVLTCLQRKVDASAVSNSSVNVEDVLNGNIIPSDYFSNPAFIDQIEDSDTAVAIFARDGDDVNLDHWEQPIPDRTGNAGKFLQTPDGDEMSWEDVEISDVTGLQTELNGLQDEIDALKGLGRFLSVWNCVTGLAETNPPESPYTYHTGDYFLVGTVGATNYRPNGSSYTIGVASTTVETAEVKVNDVYIYDGTNWKLQANSQREYTFSGIAGSPYDNTALSNALNSKVDETSSANQVYGTDQNGDQITYNTTDFGAVDDVKVNNVSVVTSKVANIDLTNYVTLSTTQEITGTKTFKTEILSWNNITFESAQANPIIRGMSGASYRNMITRTNSASAIDVGNTSDTINLKGSGTRPTYNSNDLAMYSDVPSLTGYIQNTATGTDSLTILGTAASSTNSVNIGTGAGASGIKAVSVGDYASAEGEGSIAIGGDNSTTHRARATHKGNVAIGHDAYAINATGIISIGESAHAQSTNAIQLGTGNNSTADTFQVRSYTLLDTSTGLIPDARISTNIARTSALPNVMTGATAGDAGTSGLVPAPAAGDHAKFLQGDGTWANPTASTAWGNITGTLSNQTDLQNALTAKADAATTVDTTSAQSVGGTKTFTSAPITTTTSSINLNGYYIKSLDLDRSVAPAAGTGFGQYKVVDKNDNNVATFGTEFYDTGDIVAKMQVFNANNQNAAFRIIIDSSGKSYLNTTADIWKQLAHNSMPDSIYSTLTLPAHGGSISAPGDGYFVMQLTTGVAGTGIGLNNTTAGGIGMVVSMTGSGSYIVFCPASQGDSVQVYHYNSTPDIFRFVYANGAA